MKVLVKFEKDWADEFDVRGFAVFDKAKWEADLAAFKACKTCNGCWFGTNEGWESGEVMEDKEGWIDSWDVKEITEAEANALAVMFGSPRVNFAFGTFKGPRELIDN